MLTSIDNIRKEILELIEKILIYKLPEAKREEIEAMFSLSDLKQTRFYRDAKEDGREEGKLEAKLESIPKLLQLGLTLEEIAQFLDLPVETVATEARKYPQR